MCGENAPDGFNLSGKHGSPPRVRGKPLALAVLVMYMRITPACAGKTPESLSSHFPTTNHPRVCGENYSWDIDKRCDYGSPPRVRGKLHVHTMQAREQRITPACAGKTAGDRRIRTAGADHPRVCGENLAATQIFSTFVGSPPRVRGKPVVRFGRQQSYRITPACAGKTRGGGRDYGCAADHPRVCGENSRHFLKLLLPVGSPPRVRGKRQTGEGREGRRRITPACAGKTKACKMRKRQERDHPRVCGENFGRGAEFADKYGSPPRVRGKQ